MVGRPARATPPTTTTIETAVWTGRNAVNPVHDATAVDALLVTVPEPASGALGVGAAAALAGIAALRQRGSAKAN